MATTFAVGSLVRARGREWVVLPHGEDDLLLLRPLGGTDADASGLYLPLEGDDVAPATFAPPDPAKAGDNTAALLLRDAVRLNFRAGAGPFRSLGRIAVEPRAYQLVPLLMALRLDPIRLLIADDVGIGKTIEAALIARELLDRGEIRRLAVVCPPHLCDQWQAELASKFHIDAEVVRPGTVTRLERRLPHGRSLFDLYPFVVVSIDYIKADRRRVDFVRACPEFVIVDEAHTCAAGATAGAQHQRHQLIRELARDPERHLVLTTATPHSGIEAAFRSLLELLDPAFAGIPEDEALSADDPLRRRLASHLVQRRRADILAYLDERTTFPDRVSAEVTYALGPDYRRLFDRVYAYATELVRAAEGQTRFRQRVRWWAALALLRCVTSSPAAAAATLRTRAGGLAAGDESALDVAALDALGERAVLDLDTVDAAEQDDVVPGGDTVEGDGNAPERARLRALAREAEALMGQKDRKLLGAVDYLKVLIADGFRPVVYCRYIATAEYVAAELGKRLRDVRVDAVTGRLPAEERAARVAALGEHARRLLVATDCLSEGINLQQHFDAVVHYDLSWNPTRHEQREGRVDRFGQAAPEVRTLLYYGEDNPVDAAVMKVLLRKAETIRKRLGVTVPVPAETGVVMEAVFEALFRHSDPRQLSLGLVEPAPRQLSLAAAMDEPRLREIDLAWERTAERERRSHTIFAQGTIRPEEVARELNEAARALGDAGDVARLVRDACALLDAPLATDGGYPVLTPGMLPEPVRERIDLVKPARIGFDLPVPELVVHVARTSPLVEALGSYLTDTALDPTLDGPAARCGAIRTRAVTTRATLLLLRLRLHLDVTRRGQTSSLLAEECVVAGYQGRGDEAVWLAPDEAERLLAAEPAANLPPGQREHWLRDALADLPAQEANIGRLAQARAEEVLTAHERVRAAARMTGISYQVRPTLPADVLGLYVLMPAGGAVL